MGPSDEDCDGALASFTVVLARSGREVRVEPGDSILFALISAGIDVQFSCEEGLCGACETKVLGGIALHRGTAYAATEHERRSTALICCAGSRSERLVLDL